MRSFFSITVVTALVGLATSQSTTSSVQTVTPSSPAAASGTVYSSTGAPTGAVSDSSPMCGRGFTYCGYILRDHQKFKEEDIVKAYCASSKDNCANGKTKTDPIQALYVCVPPAATPAEEVENDIEVTKNEFGNFVITQKKKDKRHYDIGDLPEIGCDDPEKGCQNAERTILQQNSDYDFDQHQNEQRSASSDCDEDDFRSTTHNNRHDGNSGDNNKNHDRHKHNGYTYRPRNNNDNNNNKLVARSTSYPTPPNSPFQLAGLNRFGGLFNNKLSARQQQSLQSSSSAQGHLSTVVVSPNTVVVSAISVISVAPAAQSSGLSATDNGIGGGDSCSNTDTPGNRIELICSCGGQCLNPEGDHIGRCDAPCS
ncbi:hypothetical protein QBC43DRAFT_369657 [Cladorrhinum sp. PSN259]|nr:hypothetical protein QBC43DRAFT_369657 [Cladorrhinum sp. PSN259]